MTYPYSMSEPTGRVIGLVVLQSDETIEADFRRLIPPTERLYVSRVPSGTTVTSDTLAAMAGHMTQAADLFPRDLPFEAVGYGCTSGAAEIGPARVDALLKAGVPAETTTDPLRAITAACAALGVTRLALLSPYIATVSARLRDRLAEAGIATPVFGSFDEAEERRVVRIDAASLHAAATDLAARGGAEALLLSCTNLRTLDVIAGIEDSTGLPVLSSNQALGWHLARLAGITPATGPYGRLWTA